MGDPWTGPPVWNVQAAVGLRRGIAPGNAPSRFGPRNGATSEPGAAPECASKDEARIPAAKASRLFEFMASRTRETWRLVARPQLRPPGIVCSDVSHRRLESWKEIAAHFGRRVRTVQRWEKEEGLPVRRHAHRLRGTVYALPEELDGWWATRSVPPAG